MMMTAAGTIAPARVFIMGVGVAGLQAIATARRLGAVVSATDVRPATKEQVESLGGTFVAVMNEEFQQAQTAGGYAKEMFGRLQAPAGGTRWRDDQKAGHRHLHGPDPGPRRARAVDGRHGQDHEARLRHRRPRGSRPAAIAR